MPARHGLGLVCALVLALPVSAEEPGPAPFLGLTVQSKELGDARLMPRGAPSLKARSCVVVTAVDPDGPCAGQLRDTDTIISIDGVPTPNVAAFNEAVKGLKPGTEIAIKGLYLAPAPAGQQQWLPGSVVVTVGAAEAGGDKGSAPALPDPPPPARPRETGTASPPTVDEPRRAAGTAPDRTPPDEAAETIALLAFRESEQVRRTAQAVVYASPQAGFKDSLVEICERTKRSMTELSLPVMQDVVARGCEDPELAAVLEKLGRLQELSMQTIVAAQRVIEADDRLPALKAFAAADGEADELYRETALAIHHLSRRGAPAAPAKRPSDRGSSAASASPDSAVFSDDEWGAIVAELRRQGVIRGSAEAADFFPMLAMLKDVFVDKGIDQPSPKQLFGLGRMLLHVDAGALRDEKVLSTFRRMLRMAEEMGMEVANRKQLLELGTDE